MKPNVFFLIIDAFRNDEFRKFCKIHPTSNLNKLVSKGNYFSQTVSSADATLLSLASMFTGLYPFKTGIKSEKLNKLNSKQLILVGMGDEKDLNYEKIRKASGTLGRFLNTMKNNSTSIIIPGDGNDNLEFNETVDAISQGLMLGTYKYDKFKTKKTPNTLSEINLINSSFCV